MAYSGGLRYERFACNFICRFFPFIPLEFTFFLSMHLFDQAKRCPKNQDALKMIFAPQNSLKRSAAVAVPAFGGSLLPLRALFSFRKRNFARRATIIVSASIDLDKCSGTIAA
jgi:hypothetical protein